MIEQPLTTADLLLADYIIVQLAHARPKPVTIGQLAFDCGASRRETEIALQQLAVSGQFAIVVDGRGVRLAETAAEVFLYTARLMARVRTQYLRVRALRKVGLRMDGVQQQALGL